MARGPAVPNMSCSSAEWAKCRLIRRLHVIFMSRCLTEAQDGNAEREADALRVVTKACWATSGISRVVALACPLEAQIKAAEEKGFEGLPDIEAQKEVVDGKLYPEKKCCCCEVLEQALKAQQPRRALWTVDM